MRNEDYLHEVNGAIDQLSDEQKTVYGYEQSEGCNKVADSDCLEDDVILEYVTDRISDMEFDYDDLEKGVEIEFAFSVNRELISFSGETVAFRDDTRMGSGSEHALYNVIGKVIVSDLGTDKVRKVIPYFEKDFEYEWITDEWNYYGVRQSDFL